MIIINQLEAYKTMAEEEFIKSNFGLVHSICKRYSPMLGKDASISYEDLFSAGCMGLCKAYKTFDTSKGVQFSTLAVPWIQGSISKIFRDGEGSVKFPRSAKEIWMRIHKEGLAGEDPCVIAEELGISVDKVILSLQFGLYKNARSLSEVEFRGKEGNDLTLEDIVSDGGDFTEQLDDAMVLQDFLSTLSDIERQIFTLQCKEMVQCDIAKLIGVSQVHISRIATKISKKAQEYGRRTNLMSRAVRPEIEEAKKLLAETDLSIAEIAERTGANRLTLYKHQADIRKPREHKVKNNKNGEVYSRPLSEEEKAKYGVKIPVVPVDHADTVLETTPCKPEPVIDNVKIENVGYIHKVEAQEKGTPEIKLLEGEPIIKLSLSIEATSLLQVKEKMDKICSSLSDIKMSSFEFIIIKKEDKLDA